MSRTRVAGRRAAVADYVAERTFGGTTVQSHMTEYGFLSPLDVPVSIAFDRPMADAQYDDMIDTMINSVRFVK